MFGGMDAFPSEADLKSRRFRRLTFEPRRPVWAGPIDYRTAVEVAVSVIARRRRERIAATVLLILTSIGLLLYWTWAIRLALARS